MPFVTKPTAFHFIGPVAATVAVHVALLALQVQKHGGDVAALVGASTAATGRPPYEQVHVGIGPGGYDGMFYYAIARNPWRHQEAGIDAPAARRLRILYSMVCWVASGGGDARRLLWVMPVVNLALLGWLAYLGGRFAVCHGRSAWWGFALVLAVNAAIPAMRDLTDCLSTLAVCGLLTAWLLSASGPVLVLWAAASVFSREQNLAVLGMVLAASLLTGRRATAAGLLGVLVLWCGWVGYLRATYGVWPFLQSEGNCAPWPMAGWLYGWTHLGGFRGSTRLALLNATSLAHWTLLLGVGLYLTTRAPGRVLSAFLVLALLAAATAGPLIYNDLMSYRRVLAWAPLGVWLAAFRLRLSWPLWLLSAAPLWSVAAALNYV